MGVRLGYKQTEVGVIPEAWEVVPVGDIFTFKNGLNKAKQFFGRGTPIVNYMDVFGKPSLRIGEVVGKVDVSPKELNAYNVRKGDVFFTRTSETVEEIGTASVMLDEPESTVYSGFVLRARPTNDILDDTFKAYCFSPRYFRKQIIARASYTTRALTNGRSLSVALLARPPLPEQRAIAMALSDVDALLEGLDRLIAKKRDLKHAAMQQLVTGQTRLPGFSESWVTVQLGDISHIKTGDRNHEDKEDGGRFPFFVRSERVERIDSFAYDCEAIIVPGEGNIGSILHYVSGRFDLHQRVYKVSDFPECIHGKFIYFAMAYGFGRHAMRNTVKATVDSLRLPTFLSFELGVPSTICEQHAIATVLSDMDDEIAALEARRGKTRALKQAMMQELLTGKTRLVRPEVAYV